MKIISGIVLMIAGLVLGLYVGIWLCLIGGIVDIVETVAGIQTFDALNVAWGVVRVLPAGTLGSLSAYLLILPGWFLIITKR